MTAPVNQPSAYLRLAEPLLAAGPSFRPGPYLRALRERRRRAAAVHARLTVWGAWMAGASIAMSTLKVLSVLLL